MVSLIVASLVWVEDIALNALPQNLRLGILHDRQAECANLKQLYKAVLK